MEFIKEKSIILLIILVFAASFVLAGTGCKEAAEEVGEAEEEVEEEIIEEAEEEIEKTFEEQIAEHVANNPTIYLATSSDFFLEENVKLMEYFEEVTGYNVEIEYLGGGNELQQLLQARFVSGEIPDIFFHNGTASEIKPLNPSENLLPLGDMEFVDKLNETLYNLYTSMDGNLYACPMGLSAVYPYFYNKKVFEAAGVGIPKSMSEMLEVTFPKLKDYGVSPIYGMGKDQWALSMEMDNFVADQMIETDTWEKLITNQIQLEETDYLAGFEWAKAVQDAGYYNDNLLEGTYDGSVTDVSEGKVAMVNIPDTVWTVFPEEAHDDLGCFTVSKSTTRCKNSGASAAFHIPIGSKNMDGALDLIKWFTQDEILTKWAEMSKVVPAYDGITLDYISRFSRESIESIDGLETFYPGDFQGYLFNAGTHMASMFAGTLTPLEAVTLMGDEWEKQAKELGIPEFQE